MQACKLVAQRTALSCRSARRNVATKAAASGDGIINPSIKKDVDKVVDMVKASELPKPKVGDLRPCFADTQPDI